MQFPGGIKDYLDQQASPASALRLLVLPCPWCPDGHPLHRHGHYVRFIVFCQSVEEIHLFRFLCTRTGHTVSLLPCFLVPRNRHALEVLAVFFQAFLLQAHTLANSVQAALPAFSLQNLYVSYQKGQYWRDCLARRVADIRAYLAQINAVLSSTPAGHPVHRVLAEIVFLLLQDHADAPAAFRHHNRNLFLLHRRFLL